MNRGTTQQRDKDRARIARARPACGICGEPIDYSLRWPHPRCYVVDHVTALNRDGADTLDNKQAAHNDCNRDKHDKPHGRVVRRSASLA